MGVALILVYALVLFVSVVFPIALALVSIVVSWILSAVLCVVKSIAIFCVAKKEGVDKAWLAWIPIARNWTLGQCADQVDARMGKTDWSWSKIMVITAIVHAALRVVGMDNLCRWALIVKNVFTLVCVSKIYRGYLAAPWDIILTVVHALFGYTFVGVLIASFFKKKETVSETFDEFDQAAIFAE